MRFIRFTLAQHHPDSGVESGVFRQAYALRDSQRVKPADRRLLAEHLSWFDKHLETPTRFNRTNSKGFYRRQTRGIAWFKDTATEHLTRMHQVNTVLERYGYPVAMVTEFLIGYVVYEDAFQAVAEPFSDTRTG